MTRNISRRSLVAGAAWAAPAVLTSTAIPAYASSVNPCQNLNDFEARQTVAAGRANNKKGYEEITVPEGATYMWFKIQGGYGAASTMLTATSVMAAQAQILREPLRSPPDRP